MFHVEVYEYLENHFINKIKCIIISINCFHCGPHSIKGAVSCSVMIPA